MRTMAVALAVSLGVSTLAGADSLFSADTEEKGSLVADSKKKYEPGDIITVLVQETVDASAEADTNTRKESDVASEAAASANQFLVADSPGGLNVMPAERLPNWDVQFEKEHRATGETTRRNKLVLSIACVVGQVHGNGNIEISGEKRVIVNRENSMMRVHGIVRSSDVTPANTVLSTQIAQAEIELKGSGPLWNNQRRGILTKILDWFSPF